MYFYFVGFHISDNPITNILFIIRTGWRS